MTRSNGANPTARPRPQMDVHVDAGRQRVGSGTMHRAWADVEGAHRDCVLQSRVDGDHAASGAQVGNPVTLRQPRLLHDVNKELGILLRG